MKKLLLIPILFFAQSVQAQVVINEVQISPIGERFVELYNSGSADIDLTGWYIQRKTTSGTSFGSLVSSTLMKGQTIRANGYFLISRSQLANSDVVAGDMTLTASNIIRIRNSKGDDVDQVEWGTIPDGKSTQRLSALEWITSTPTPRAVNSSSADSQSQNSTATTAATVSQSSPLNIDTFPVEPQIIADAGSSSRTISTGATAIFSGRVFGLKKEPIENARLVWSFGDGGRTEGATVTHTYYYPGDYIVVLDASSGYYSANDRALVHAVAPLLSIKTGGDGARSFIAIENFGSDEIDLSSWQLAGAGKVFVLPQNTILGAKKVLTLASEISGLITPAGSEVVLNFPNGTRVEMKNTMSTAQPSSSIQKPVATKSSNTTVISQQQKVAQPTNAVRPSKDNIQNQGASVIDAVQESPISQNKKDDGLWIWYTTTALLAALALLGLRFVRHQESTPVVPNPADEYTIIETSADSAENEPH